jgi:hypothetical protein
MQQAMQAHGLRVSNPSVGTAGLPLPPDVTLYDMATIREEVDEDGDELDNREAEMQDRPFRFPETDASVEMSGMSYNGPNNESGLLPSEEAITHRKEESVKQTFDEFKVTSGVKFNL